jgi:hypothetical protein
LRQIPAVISLIPVLGVGLFSAAGCAPRAVDRTAEVMGRADASSPPAPPAVEDAAAKQDLPPPPAPGGTGGRGGTGGVVRADAAADRPTRDAAAAADLAAERSGVELVTALLALTPQACAMKLSRDFDLESGGGSPDAGTAGTAAICGLDGAVYWVADMNITCDGRSTAGKCTIAHDDDTFTHTRGGQALAPAVTPFVVVPAGLDIPGLRAGTVVAVINRANNRMTYAVFGDTSASSIGAASWACAEKVGIDPDPRTGGQKGNTVVYIAFTGANAAPGNVESQTEAATLGQTLASKLLVDNK